VPGPFRISKNGCQFPGYTITSYEKGEFQVGAVDIGTDGCPRDSVEATYQFDYFPVEVLEGFFNAAVEVVNTGAIGPPTNYKLDGSGTVPPDYWDGVLLDLAFAMAMEKLLLDYDLWKYRLVFAIGPNEVYGGGGDIVGQLETLKSNAESRAARTLENEKFKTGNYLSPPTSIYFQSIRGAGTSSPHGIPFLTGRLRGWKPNRYV
jgi:hypothetical protein